MHKHTRTLVAIASTATLAMALSAQAATTPVLEYSFPTSYSGGTGAVVTDVSPAGNNGLVSTTAGRQPVLSTTVPPGAASGTESVNTTAGGMETTNKSLLSNSTIAAAGGFTYTTEFLWDGTDNSNHVEKLIDYAGTDSMQLDTIDAVAGTANLDFIFTTQGVSPAPDTTVGPTLPIVKNTWYQATAIFNTEGNPVAGDGTLPGLATIMVGPVGGPFVSATLPVTKTTYGDSLIRPIGVGELGFTSTTLALVLFHGNIYDPQVSLGAVPEPASLGLLCAGVPLLLKRRARLTK